MLQKRVVRVNTESSYNSHALPLFARLKQLTVFDLNRVLIATFMYKYHKHCLPPIFSNYFIVTSTVHDHFTRSSSKLHISFARTDIMKSQLRVYGPKLWNSIDPALIKSSKNWHSFKKQYKMQILLNYT
jgi:hypothetical protein